MGTSREINITSLHDAHRRALEHVLGAQLHANQRVTINGADGNVEHRATALRPAQTLEDWTNVYRGLSDDEIEEIDNIVKTRDNLTRDLP